MPIPQPEGLGKQVERNRDIFLRDKAGEPRAKIAEDFGISATRVAEIVRRAQRYARRGASVGIGGKHGA